MSQQTQQTEAELHEAIWTVLRQDLPVVVTSHTRADGDGVGSALALWHGLRQLGLEADHLFPPPIPPMFGFLPGLGESIRAEELPGRYNLVVIDCGCFERTGELSDRLSGANQVVNIDHHDSNTMFGDLNYVDRAASSCGEMLWDLLRRGGVEPTAEIGRCLFSAIITDTGQFSHQDTTARAFIICGRCVEAGARPHELIRQLFLSPSPAQVKLRHLALGTLQFHHQNRAATMVVTLEMFRRSGLGPEDTEGFADIPIAIQGVEASALLKEMPERDYIKVSMRSKEPIDVCAVARAFGGGGHRHAAGCEVYDTLENARKAVAEQFDEQFRRVEK